MLINNGLERGSENKYFPRYCQDQFIYEQYFLCHFSMEIVIKGLVQFIGFENNAVFGFFADYGEAIAGFWLNLKCLF